MSQIPFHNTRMGHTFFEHTMPELVRQITRLNDLLEQIAAASASSEDRPEEQKQEASR